MKELNSLPTSSSQTKHLDLNARAYREMVENGFAPNFEPAINQEIASYKNNNSKVQFSSVRDLRSLLWSSIDNPDSRDLDQLEYVEQLPNKDVRLLIAIADVDALVPKDSATDHHASINTTSVYTGVVTYPMLPDQLSTDLTSLIQDSDRQAIVIDLTIDDTGSILKSDIFPALVRNQAKLDYIMVGNWLEDGDPTPEKINNVPGLSAQLRLQNDLKERLRLLRQQQGSLFLETLEATTVMRDGEVTDLQLVKHNPARDLIENFMIAGNIAISHFLEAKQWPSIRRVVKTPERWSRIIEVASSFGEQLPAVPNSKALSNFLSKRKDADPLRFPDLSLTIVKLLGRGEYTVEIPGQIDEGHFALAIHDYTHATAPNRRYADLITQRLVKASLLGKSSPYTVDELKGITSHCTEREDAANKVERTMRKVAAAVLLSKHIGETFEGIVTGIKDDATYVRLFKPPAEGRIIQGEHGLDVGDKVNLRLMATDPERAFIDFARK